MKRQTGRHVSVRRNDEYDYDRFDGQIWDYMAGSTSECRMMADLAQANYENGCFENVGVPFCMTIEAESMGAKVTLGDRVHEPHVTEYALNSVKEWEKIRPMEYELRESQGCTGCNPAF